MISIYELADQGIDPHEFLAKLSPQARRSVLASWEWRARPGQRWTPGPEKITDIEAGRAWGKTAEGSEAIAEAACDPDRWGGAAIIGGRDPTQVRRDCLEGRAGIFAAARRRAEAGIGPGIAYTNYNDRLFRFEAPRGGGIGLTVYWAASSNPQSFRGLNLGLAWCDEFGVWHHAMKDDTGANAWKSLRPAMRVGPSPKIIITQTPGRSPEIRELQRDAERPECPTCQTNWHLDNKGKVWKGEPGDEPWRLPRSERPKVHPLLGTRTTTPVRTCPVCAQVITAEVRLVTGATLDNPHLPSETRELAIRALRGGTQASRFEFDPQGEADAAPKGALVNEDKIIKILVPVPADHQDRWEAVKDFLQIIRTVVFVDPAVTSTANSDDTGVVVAGLRRVTTPEGHTHEQVVLLQDASVRAEDVQGAPSAIWAPLAFRLAQEWSAEKISVETNQGGEEVLSSLRAALNQPPGEPELLIRIAEQLERPVLVRGLPSLVPTARRMMGASTSVYIETVHRRSDKRTRWGWYGEGASRGEQAVACLSWLDGATHWAPALAQAVTYEPGAKKDDKKDRFDAAVAAAQVLQGVREVKGGIKEKGGSSWMMTSTPNLLR